MFLSPIADQLDSGKCCKVRENKLTSLLLLDRQILPIALHAIAQGHPEVSLLLERHALPALLNVGQGGLRDGVTGRGGDRRLGAAGSRGAAHQAVAQHARCRGTQHVVGYGSTERMSGENRAVEVRGP